MAIVTAEGSLWINMADVYAWLEWRGIRTEGVTGVRFSIEEHSLILERKDGTRAEIDATELWTWVIHQHLPKSFLGYETVFGVPKVVDNDLVINFAASSDGDPLAWAVLPACMAEWEQPQSNSVQAKAKPA